MFGSHWVSLFGAGRNQARTFPSAFATLKESILVLRFICGETGCRECRDDVPRDTVRHVGERISVAIHFIVFYHSS